MYIYIHKDLFGRNVSVSIVFFFSAAWNHQISGCFFNDRRFKRNWSLRTETTRPLLVFRLVYESTFMTISIENVRTPPWEKTNVYDLLQYLCGSCWDITWNYIASSIRFFLKKRWPFSWHHSKSFSIAPLWTLLKLSAGWPERTMILTATWWNYHQRWMDWKGAVETCVERGRFTLGTWNLRTEVFVWKEHPLPTFIFAF